MRTLDYLKISNIMDSVQPKLDQRVFKDEEPRSSIQSFIQKIYYRAFEKHFGIPAAGLINLYMTGSLTTYQYSDTSDCDIGVFPNYDEIHKRLGLDPTQARKELVSMSIGNLDGTFLPGGSHPLQFFVMPDGATPEETYKHGVRSGYSLGSHEWVNPPEKDRVHDVQVEFPEMYRRAEAMAQKMRDMLDHDPDKARELWRQIHTKRRLDEEAGLGDFSEGNITYKYLLYEGLFDRIRKELGEYIAAVEEPTGWRPAMPPQVLDRFLQAHECPWCHGNLLAEDDKLYCPSCGSEFQKTAMGLRGDITNELTFTQDLDHAVDGRANKLYAWYQGKVVGRLSWMNGEIIAVRVEQDYRRMGVATAMLHEAEQIEGSPIRHSPDLSEDGQNWAIHVDPDHMEYTSKTAEDDYSILSPDAPDDGVVNFLVGQIRGMQGNVEKVRSFFVNFSTLFTPEKRSQLVDEAYEIYKQQKAQGDAQAEELRQQFQNRPQPIEVRWAYYNGRVIVEKDPDNGKIHYDMIREFGLDEDVLDNDNGNDDGWGVELHQDNAEGLYLGYADYYPETGQVEITDGSYDYGDKDLTTNVEGAVTNAIRAEMSKTSAYTYPSDTFFYRGSYMYKDGKIYYGGLTHPEIIGKVFGEDFWEDATLYNELVHETVFGNIGQDSEGTYGADFNTYEARTDHRAINDAKIKLSSVFPGIQFYDKLRIAFDNNSWSEDIKTASVSMKVIYDFQQDHIILGTMAQAQKLPDTKIIGEYDGTNVKLYQTSTQWLNANYFRRLWSFSFPKRRLDNVYLDSDGEVKHIPSRDPKKSGASQVFKVGDVAYDSAFVYLGTPYNKLLFEPGVFEHRDLLERFARSLVKEDFDPDNPHQQYWEDIMDSLAGVPMIYGHIGMEQDADVKHDPERNPLHYYKVYSDFIQNAKLDPRLMDKALFELRETYPNIQEYQGIDTWWSG
jgi:GNAT superfamily N-acetyltransferase